MIGEETKFSSHSAGLIHRSVSLEWFTRDMEQSLWSLWIAVAQASNSYMLVGGWTKPLPEKYAQVKLDHLPQFRDENKKDWVATT